ncbi:MAG TPA: zf-TFIIB domain-containing protein [Gammaproteobacteria bacterium]
MKCPIDETPLVMTERQGIEIDYCPRCRGVWLDRGELDKLIERSHGGPPPDRPFAREHERPRHYDDDDDDDDDYRFRRRRKRESFLSELFDFD